MIRKLIFYGGLTILGVGVYRYYKRQAEVLEDFDYRITNIKIENLKWDNIKLLVSTLIHNKSDIGFTITGYDIEVFLDGKKIADVQNSNLAEQLKPNSNSPINFYVMFSPQDIIGSGLQIGSILKNLKTTQLQMKGKVSLKKGLFGYSNYPVDILYTLDEFL